MSINSQKWEDFLNKSFMKKINQKIIIIKKESDSTKTSLDLKKINYFAVISAKKI